MSAQSHRLHALHTGQAAADVQQHAHDEDPLSNAERNERLLAGRDPNEGSPASNAEQNERIRHARGAAHEDGGESEHAFQHHTPGNAHWEGPQHEASFRSPGLDPWQQANLDLELAQADEDIVAAQPQIPDGRFQAVTMAPAVPSHPPFRSASDWTSRPLRYDLGERSPIDNDDAPRARQRTDQAEASSDGGTATWGLNRNTRTRQTSMSGTAGHEREGFVLGAELGSAVAGPDADPSVRGRVRAGLQLRTSDAAHPTQQPGLEATAGHTGPSGTRTTGSFGAGHGGVVGRVNASRDLTHADGATGAVTGGGTVNFSEGIVGASAGYQRTRPGADGTPRHQASVNATGNVDMDERGSLQGASGAAGASVGPASASFSGRFHVSTGAIVADGAGFTVSYTHIVGFGVGGGLERHAPAGGVGVGASASHDQQELQRGELHFSTRALAEDFKRRAPDDLDEYLTDVGSAAAVLQMHEGQQQSDGSSTTNSVAASASFMNMGAGLDASVAHNESAEVIRGHGDRVDVRVRIGDLTRHGASLSGIGLTMRAGERHRESDTVTIRFDLGDAHGRAAFEAYQADGNLPSDQTGWTVAFSDHTEADGTDHSVELFGMHGGTVEEVADSEQVVNGRHRHVTHGSHQSDTSFMGHGGSQTAYFEAVRAGQDDERSYVLGADVNGANNAESSAGLARATGTGMSTRGDTETDSGQWRVQTQLSPAELGRFVSEVRSGGANVAELMSGSDDGEALRQALQAAGNDQDAQAHAVATFISASGFDGFNFIRNHSGSAGEVDIELDGDRYLGGASQRIALENRIARYGDALQSPSAQTSTILRNIAGELNGLRFRLRALEDRARYPDLPEQLRERELERTREHMDQLRALQSSGPAPQQDDDGHRAGDTRSEAQRAQDLATYGEVSVNGLSAVMQQTLATAQQHINHVQALMQSSLDRVTFSRRVHLEGYGAFGGGVAHDRLGPSSHWFASDGSETHSYAHANSAFVEGEHLRSQAEAGLQSADEARAILADPSQMYRYGPVATGLVASSNTVAETFLAAKTKFDTAEGQYQAIVSNHPEEAGRLFAGYATPPR